MYDALALPSLCSADNNPLLLLECTGVTPDLLSLLIAPRFHSDITLRCIVKRLRPPSHSIATNLIPQRQSPSTPRRRSPSPNSTRCHHQYVSNVPISYTMRPPDLQPKLKVRRDLIAQAVGGSDQNSSIGIFQRKVSEPPDIRSSTLFSSESKAASAPAATATSCVKSEIARPSHDQEEADTPPAPAPAPSPAPAPPPAPPKKHGFSIEDIMRR
ncbi:hypothetical protein WDU94_005137 [Cyamophila willieti]